MKGRTMQTESSATERLEREYLPIRHCLIDLAAMLDRIERGHRAEAARADRRWEQIHAALVVLQDGRPDRTERVQMIFSDPYDERWREKMNADKAG